MTQMVDSKVYTIFFKVGSWLVHGIVVLTRCVQIGNLYKLDVTTQVMNDNAMSMKKLNQWKHRRHQAYFCGIFGWDILVK